MLKITITDAPRQAFINRACQYAIKPIHIKFCDDYLLITGLSYKDAASILAYASFFVFENYCLHNLIHKYFPNYINSCADDLAAIAQILAEEDIPDNPLYQGKNRSKHLADAFTEELTQGSLNFLGFCRFRLAEYTDYLYQLLIRAEEELLAEVEEYKYFDLLRNSLSIGQDRISLFFSKGDICQIWKKDENGFHQLEGGHIKGAEWLLIVNLIAQDPKQITIYNATAANPTLIKTLKSVFVGKIEFDIKHRFQNTATTIT